MARPVLQGGEGKWGGRGHDCSGEKVPGLIPTLQVGEGQRRDPSPHPGTGGSGAWPSPLCGRGHGQALTSCMGFGNFAGERVAALIATTLPNFLISSELCRPGAMVLQAAFGLGVRG